MSGNDTVRGIGYQQAQAVLVALDVLDDSNLGSMRVEGRDEVVDIEVFERSGALSLAMQVKTRVDKYAWAQGELHAVLMRWVALPESQHASFEFLTDGRLGPSGEHLQHALAAAAEGDFALLEDVVPKSMGGAALDSLARARVRLDPVGVGALLDRAVRQVVALLPNGATTGHEDVAEAAVLRLFARLFDHAGSTDVAARLVTREEIAGILGVPADQSATQRWPGALRDDYIAKARVSDLSGIVALRLRRVDWPGFGTSSQSAPAPVSTMMEDPTPTILFGRTGSGKSTVCRLVLREAALSNRIALVAHAETYIPGRLAALAADAIGHLVAAPLPAATGRQALWDPDVTLIIDGASEVPVDLRHGLGEEMRALVASGAGARFVLVGRDVAALREVLPTSTPPTLFEIVPLDFAGRVEIGRAVLSKQVRPSGDQLDDAAVEALVRKVERALGDAMGNPLLFTMGMTLASEGTPLTSRAGLYAAFVERLAGRTGASGIAEAALALGIVYAHLLDDGRRYADRFEWQWYLADAVAQLRVSGLDSDVAGVSAAVLRCGIVNPVGYTQILAPLHDSFADYLAGSAHARGLVHFSQALTEGDEQRVLFAAELSGVDHGFAERIARTLPFLLVRLTKFERGSIAEDSAAEVTSLLSLLLPPGVHAAVALGRDIDGRMLAQHLPEGGPKWKTDISEFWEVAGTPFHVFDASVGPLRVAVALWRTWLDSKLSENVGIGAPHPRSQEAARKAMETHAIAEGECIGRLAEMIAPAGYGPELRRRIGPLGLVATVGPATPDGYGLGEHYPVSFHWSESTSVTSVTASDRLRSARVGPWGSSAVEHIIRTSPEAAAANRLRSVINAITSEKWM